MSPVKITALILVFAAGIVGLSFVSKNNFSTAPVVPNSFERSESSKAVSAPITLGKPFHWLKEVSETVENKIETRERQDIVSGGEIKIEEQINSLWQKTMAPIAQSPSQSPFSAPQPVESDIPFIPDSEMSIRAEGAKNSAEYYERFIASLKEITFTDNERAAMKKDKDGIMLLLEELLDEAIAAGDLSALRTSFAGWRNLDGRVLTELGGISVHKKTTSTHRLMLGWYKYHSGIAQKLSEEELNQEQLKELREQFKKNAETHNSGFRASLASLKNSPNFAFVSVPEAEAVTCGAVVPPPFYHFGGRVITTVGCAQGIVETISPPCGGEILFPYPVLAANPYLYKKPIIGSEVLGRATFVPGVCISVPPIPYEATVLYFGSSLLP